MNTLYAYPFFMPISTNGNIPIEFFLSSVIVTNAIWIIVFIVAIIHKSIQKKIEGYNDKLMDIGYFVFASSFGIIIDGIAIFFGLVYWVSKLL